jgi:acetolactate synthase I/II/III large subunit
LAGYARSLGAEGHTVRDPDRLAPAMEDALASDTITLLDVVTDPDIISPSTTLSEIESP